MGKKDRKLKGKEESSPVKVKTKKQDSAISSAKSFYKEYKTAIWISLCVFLAFYMKFAEEGSYSRN